MEDCLNCEKLKETLSGLGIEYEEQDIETKEVIIDLLCLGCFPQEAPVIFGKEGSMNRHLIHRISGKVF